MITYVISGASRGLGLGLVERVLELQDTRVIAAARNPGKSEELQTLANDSPDRLTLLTLDTSDEASIKEAASHLEQTHPDGIDYLVNVAGVADEKFQSALETDGADYVRVLTVNTVGPFLMTKLFLPLLRKKRTRTLVNVSSEDGSISINRSGQHGEQSGMQLAYSCSKAALNMQTSVMAHALKAEGFTIICMCPGWVQTDMGSRAADESSQPELTVAESTAKQLSLIRRLTPADSGKYFSAAEDRELPY